jgi:hypothetical protein
MLIFLALLLGVRAPALAQPAPSTGSGQAERIRVVLEVRSEGIGSRDDVATRLMAAVRQGLEVVGDVEIVPRDRARRIIWIVAGTTPGTYAASVIITEQYDRETLMVLGIEDDDMAGRMMALQIVNDHQIFTGRDLPTLARRIVTAIDDGVFKKLRTLKR